MAEFLGQKKPTKLNSPPDSGFAAMGKPIPIHRKQAAEQHLKAMGVKDPEDIFRCVALVAGKLERDEPYAAMNEAMRYVDLTGAYRLLSALLAG